MQFTYRRHKTFFLWQFTYEKHQKTGHFDVFRGVFVMRENHTYFLTILISSISLRVLAREVCCLSHPELDP